MSDIDSDVQRLETAVNSLLDHYDSVQIFVTRHEPAEEGGTVNIDRGSGNWFARFGQVRNWVIKQDERTRIQVQQQTVD